MWFYYPTRCSGMLRLDLSFIGCHGNFSVTSLRDKPPLLISSHSDYHFSFNPHLCFSRARDYTPIFSFAIGSSFSLLHNRVLPHVYKCVPYSISEFLASVCINVYVYLVGITYHDGNFWRCRCRCVFCIQVYI